MIDRDSSQKVDWHQGLSGGAEKENLSVCAGQGNFENDCNLAIL